MYFVKLNVISGVTSCNPPCGNPLTASKDSAHESNEFATSFLHLRAQLKQELKDITNIVNLQKNLPTPAQLRKIKLSDNYPVYKSAIDAIALKKEQFLSECKARADLISTTDWKPLADVLPDNCKEHLTKWAAAEATLASAWLKNPRLPFFYDPEMILSGYFTNVFADLRIIDGTHDAKKREFTEDILPMIQRIETPEQGGEEQYTLHIARELAKQCHSRKNTIACGHSQLHIRVLMSFNQDLDSWKPKFNLADKDWETLTHPIKISASHHLMVPILGPSASGKTYAAAHGVNEKIAAELPEVDLSGEAFSSAFLAILDGGVLREVMPSWQAAKSIPIDTQVCAGFKDLYDILKGSIEGTKQDLGNFMFSNKMSFFMPETGYTSWSTDGPPKNDRFVSFLNQAQTSGSTVLFVAVLSDREVCRTQGMKRQAVEGKIYKPDTWQPAIESMKIVAKHVDGQHGVHDKFIVYDSHAKIDSAPSRTSSNPYLAFYSMEPGKIVYGKATYDTMTAEGIEKTCNNFLNRADTRTKRLRS